jgi:DNA-binding CsgD family transcriptional regulator
MSSRLRISEEDLEQMRLLKSQGYSNRAIADMFNIAKSTVWDNIYKDKSKQVKVIIPPYRRLEIAKEVIKIRREQGKNTMEVAQELDIPLKEVNYIWGNLQIVTKVVLY